METQSCIELIYGQGDVKAGIYMDSRFSLLYNARMHIPNPMGGTEYIQTSAEIMASNEAAALSFSELHWNVQVF